MQKKYTGIFLLLPAILVLGGCTKDRIFDPSELPETPLVQTDTLTVISGPGGQQSLLHPGDLLINEFVATGSVYPNELGAPSDWVELYNSRSDTLTMYNSYWFMTDSLGDKGKYQLPVTVKIPPHGHYVIQCDGSDTYVTEIHTNFKLSAGGEQLGLYYSADGANFRTIDEYTFGAQTSGPSTGRLPDGGSVWTTLTPTPGAVNQQ